MTSLLCAYIVDGKPCGLPAEALLHSPNWPKRFGHQFRPEEPKSGPTLEQEVRNWWEVCPTPEPDPRFPRCEDCGKFLRETFALDEDGRRFHHGCGGAEYALRMSKIPGTPEFKRAEAVAPDPPRCVCSWHETHKNHASFCPCYVPCYVAPDPKPNKQRDPCSYRGPNGSGELCGRLRYSHPCHYRNRENLHQFSEVAEGAAKPEPRTLKRIREILDDHKNYQVESLKLGGIWDVCDRAADYRRSENVNSIEVIQPKSQAAKPEDREAWLKKAQILADEYLGYDSDDGWRAFCEKHGLSTQWGDSVLAELFIKFAEAYTQSTLEHARRQR